MNEILLNGLLYEKYGTGISVYTKNLIDQFTKQNEYHIDMLLRKEYEKDYKDEISIRFADKVIEGSKDRILYEQIQGLKQYNKYELVHFPDYAMSIGCKAKKIVTIHDMAMFTMTKAYTRKQILVKQTLLKQSVRRANGILCDSEYAKKELKKYFPEVEDRRIKVVHLGVTMPVKCDALCEQDVLSKFRISKEYILYVGTIAPSKNIISLLKAFQIIKQDGVDVQLVIAGKKGWMYEDIELEYNQSQYKDDIIFTDFIPQETLEILYKQATLFVSPSLYEGFGLPPLEAMIRKVPVAISNIEIFKEICGDAAYYFDPLKPQEIAQQLIKIITDTGLKTRLIARGFERAQEFTWEKTAKQTYKFYEDILNQ
ncbi:MAG: glycosyltransferase family 4 protein [Cellulosilyticaceae bacterium]